MAAPASASWRSPVVESAVGGGHTDKVGETHSQSAQGEDTQVPETVGETKGTEDCGDSFQRDRDFTKRRRDFLATWYKAGFGQNQGKGKRVEKK